jgi:hypothetical protein
MKINEVQRNALRPAVDQSGISVWALPFFRTRVPDRHPPAPDACRSRRRRHHRRSSSNWISSSRSKPAEFTLQPKGGTTSVTWAMHGPSPYISKLIGIFFNIDRMIGKDFEAGLANLKAIAER